MNFVQIVAEELQIAAGAVFEHEGHAAGGADAGNGGRREREGNAVFDAVPAPATMWPRMAAYCSFFAFALDPTAFR